MNNHHPRPSSVVLTIILAGSSIFYSACALKSEPPPVVSLPPPVHSEPEKHPVINIKGSQFVAARSMNVQAGVLPYGKDVIHASPPYEGNVRCVASFDVFVGQAGKYTLQVEYAALHDRPMLVRVNGVDAHSLPMPANGGWEERYQAWGERREIQLRAGLNDVTLIRDGAIAHIRTIRFIRIPGEK